MFQQGAGKKQEQDEEDSFLLVRGLAASPGGALRWRRVKCLFSDHLCECLIIFQ